MLNSCKRLREGKQKMQTRRPYDLRGIAATASAALGVPAPATAESGIIPEVSADLAGAKRLALIVMDGFGCTLWDHTRASVPILNQLSEIHHVVISSVVPSLTHVCISSMLTGISPRAHGVTDLEGMIRVAAESGVETLFGVVRDAGGTTLIAAHRGGVNGVPLERFADHVLVCQDQADEQLHLHLPELLRDHLPTFAFIHLVDVDEAAHAHGPQSPEVRLAASSMDRGIGRLCGEFARLEYGLIAVADHGLHAALDGEEDSGHLGVHDGSSEEDLNVPLLWASAEELRGLHLPGAG